jgi:hypothetical protein
VLACGNRLRAGHFVDGTAQRVGVVVHEPQCYGPFLAAIVTPQARREAPAVLEMQVLGALQPG